MSSKVDAMDNNEVSLDDYNEYRNNNIHNTRMTTPMKKKIYYKSPSDNEQDRNVQSLKSDTNKNEHRNVHSDRNVDRSLSDMNERRNAYSDRNVDRSLSDRTRDYVHNDRNVMTSLKSDRSRNARNIIDNIIKSNPERRRRIPKKINIEKKDEYGYVQRELSKEIIEKKNDKSENEIVEKRKKKTINISDESEDFSDENGTNENDPYVGNYYNIDDMNDRFDHENMGMYEDNETYIETNDGIYDNDIYTNCRSFGHTSPRRTNPNRGRARPNPDREHGRACQIRNGKGRQQKRKENARGCWFLPAVFNCVVLLGSNPPRFYLGFYLGLPALGFYLGFYLGRFPSVLPAC